MAGDESVCDHVWWTDTERGEDVCTRCGVVGQPVFLPRAPAAEDDPSQVSGYVARTHEQCELAFRLVRDEVTETIMRISGGDCAGLHVDSIMTKLKTWHNDANHHVRAHIVKCVAPHHPISRGILAVAIQHGLLDNGRQETLEHIAAAVGATMQNVQLAEKLLRVSRSYLRSSVLLRKIVDSLDDIGDAWRDVIFELSECNAVVSFRDPDVVVASITLALGRRIRAGARDRRTEMTKDHSARVRAQLRAMTGAALCKKLRLTYGTVNRASLGLDEMTTQMMQRRVDVLLMV